MTLAIDATSHIPAVVTPANPQTVAHVCGASASLLVVLPASAGSTLGTRQFGAVSYNSVSMGARLQEDDDGTWAHTEVFTLASPSTGSNTLSVGNNVPTLAGAVGVSFVDGEVRSSGGTTGTSTNPGITGITTVAGDIVVGVLNTDNAIGNTAEAGTLLFEDEDVNSDNDYNWQYVVASGTSTNLSWTNSDSGTGWAISYVVVKQISGGGSSISALRYLDRQRRR